MRQRLTSPLLKLLLAAGVLSCGGNNTTGSTPQATKYVIVDPTDGVVGTPVTVTVEARDANNAVFTDENRDVTLVVNGSATGGGLVDIVNGTGTIDVSDLVAETVSLSLSDSRGTGLNVSSTQNVAFAAGPGTKVVIVNPTDGVAGIPVSVTLHALDAYDNAATTAGQFTLVTDGSATGGGVVALANGVGTIDISDNVVETVNLSLQDVPGNTGLDVSSTQDVAFGPTGATKFVILSPPTGTTGSPVTVTVEAQNGGGARATQENRDVTLVTDGSATGGGVVDITNGVGTINIGDAVIETVNLSLTDHLALGLDVSSVATATFTGPPTQLVFRPIAGGAATQSITIEVELQDAGGNLTGASNDVTIAFDQNPGAMLFHASGFGSRVLEYVNYISPQVVSPPLPNTQSDEINGLVYDSTNNRIIGGQVGVDNLMTYDVRTGAETVLGSGGFGEGPSGMAFEMGGANRLLGISSNPNFAEHNDLFEINPANGAMTSLGTLTAGFAFDGLQGLATDPTTGTIYGVAMEPSPNRTTRHLVTIDVATFAMTDLGVIGQSGIAEITFVPDGTLLGVTGDGGANPETLFSIDKTNGAATLILAMGNGDDGEAVTYIPAQLVGSVTVSAVNGVATFSVKIPAPATGYTLTATAAGLPDATSGAFNITP
jgi:hypothetical protein